MMFLFSLFIVFSTSTTISGNDDYAAFNVETRLLCHGEAYSGASVAFYKRDLPVSDLCYVTTSNETGKVAAHGWEFDHSSLFSNTLFFFVRHNCNQAQETVCTKVKLPDSIWTMYHQIPDRATVVDDIELSEMNQQSCPTRVQMDFPQKFGGGMCRRSSLSDYQISLFTCVYHGGDCDEDGEV
ncbi:hypothetical protein M3Y94_00910700 [Aphelenchoides besseyi]|nr:hypothetical protein M3Y94_00910700 [Aphelenchoides besseyi]